jgi:hypothetical protein
MPFIGSFNEYCFVLFSPLQEANETSFEDDCGGSEGGGGGGGVGAAGAAPSGSKRKREETAVLLDRLQENHAQTMAASAEHTNAMREQTALLQKQAALQQKQADSAAQHRAAVLAMQQQRLELDKKTAAENSSLLRELIAALGK